VFQGFLRRDALLWVHLQEALEEGNLRLRHLPQVVLLESLRAGDFLELHPDKARVLQEGLLLGVRQRAEQLRVTIAQQTYLLDDEELILLRLTRKHRVAVSQFPENAADGPYVDLDSVVALVQQQLRWPVSARRDIVRQLAALLREDPREAEVAELQDPIPSKSKNAASACLVIKRFSGLMSRWTTSSEWQ